MTSSGVTTKAFSAWWRAAMARRFGDETSFFTVSPGSNMSTNAARHGFQALLSSGPKKMVGPLHEVTVSHLLDTRRQDVALSVLDGLAGVAAASGRQAAQA
jgi:hypothetical protein